MTILISRIARILACGVATSAPLSALGGSDCPGLDALVRAGDWETARDRIHVSVPDERLACLHALAIASRQAGRRDEAIALVMRGMALADPDREGVIYFDLLALKLALGVDAAHAKADLAMLRKARPQVAGDLAGVVEARSADGPAAPVGAETDLFADPGGREGQHPGSNSWRQVPEPRDFEHSLGAGRPAPMQEAPGVSSPPAADVRPRSPAEIRADEMMAQATGLMKAGQWQDAEALIAQARTAYLIAGSQSGVARASETWGDCLIARGEATTALKHYLIAGAQDAGARPRLTRKVRRLVEEQGVAFPPDVGNWLTDRNLLGQ